MAKSKVLLTGASGSMGGEAFKELLTRRDKYDIRLLLRPSKVNKGNFTKFESYPGVEIVWGDLTSADDCMRAVTGVQFVLHPAAFIAPAADHKPLEARKINTGGTMNLVDAIKAQKHPEDIKLVYVGSVAEYGDRRPPIHMIKVGDPLKPCVHDHYATTKIDAEKYVMESGLPCWSSIRQTFIAIPNTFGLMDPIMFHQPPDQHIELITGRDAGFGLVQCMETPDDFWGRVYNMGGGPRCRVVYMDMMDHMMKVFGFGDYTKIMDLNWFGRQNFHCGWYADSWILNEYTGHWRDTLQDYYRSVEEASPWYLKLGGRIAPNFIVKQVMKRMADPLKWAQAGNEDFINPFFGSMEAWKKIPSDWKSYVPKRGEVLDCTDVEGCKQYNVDDLKDYATSRGGELISSECGDRCEKVAWKCARGHEFELSPIAAILGGNWCPECAPPEWDLDGCADVDPFFAKFHNRLGCGQVKSILVEEA